MVVWISDNYYHKKVQTRVKLKAKMVNTAFAYQFTWGCKI